ncbi:MAG: class I SAM-dependent rRNA methyltransferase [Gammaproteobacteria bacterium]|nr:class I SAM-dependent rRNA methyltransferase [Gammaproteobacteria bacterium]
MACSHDMKPNQQEYAVTSSLLPELRLKKNEARRLQAGHLWIYSNEVDTKATPLKQFQAGDEVKVVNDRGQTMGFAYVNPKTLICARIYSYGLHKTLDQTVISERIANALHWREQQFEQPCYRLIYGESDALPGLVVDRFFDTLVVQITTAGMENLKQEIIAALTETVQPQAILLRNDSPARELEGLPIYTETVLGEVQETVSLIENNTHFEISLQSGQKTGWYYDHRLNRLQLQKYVKDKRVLDVFSYVGAWGMQALQAGAAHVTCTDASARFLEQAQKNAELNHRSDDLSIVAGDAFDVLKEFKQQGKTFDVVVLDPPAFIKRRKDFKEGCQAYERINRLAMQLIEDGGLLVSASCSYHLPADQLRNEIRRAARKSRRFLQIVEQGHQGLDHPVHPAMPETDYLKAFFCRIGGNI